ncbi:MAG: amidohydrolase/deacetylase family metallohydrolase, partial [Acidobacteria bacterium]|nr:amidohydrolase/deacetylase family metallohydrolase [Acidobacteriota bacterium]
MRLIVTAILLAAAAAGQERYDLLLKGGHVIDPANQVNRVLDVAVA